MLGRKKLVEPDSTALHIAFLLDGENVEEHIENLPRVVAAVERLPVDVFQLSHVWVWPNEQQPHPAHIELIGEASDVKWSDQFVTTCLCNPRGREYFASSLAGLISDPAFRATALKDDQTEDELQRLGDLIFSETALLPDFDLLVNTLQDKQGTGENTLAGTFTLEAWYSEWVLAPGVYRPGLVQEAYEQYAHRDRRKGATPAAAK